MLKKRIAITLPLIALSLSVLACNMPAMTSLDAQASELSEAEIEAQVNQALLETQANEDVLQPLPADEPQGVTPDADADEVNEVPAQEPVVTEEPEPVTPEIETCTDRAQFITDVTVDDGADFAPGDEFTKTWRLRNSGSCTWTSSYDLVFDHGDQMGGLGSKALPGLVNPGDTVDISVELEAPSDEGGYKGYWLLRNGEDVLFGIGADANVAFWVEIEVLEEDDDGDFPVFEIVPIPMFPIFVSSGTGQNLPSGACFDLDAGSLVGCGSAAADFQYLADFEMIGFPPIPKLSMEIHPRHGARFALFGDDLPTGEQCQSSPLADNPANIQSKVYCYQTNAGKYGRLTILGGDLASLSFDWATYTFP